MSKDRHFAVDIETMGRKGSAIILSIGAVYADMDQDFTFDEIVENNSMFVKLDAKAQKESGRTITKDTMEWWKNQSKEAQEQSLKPSPDDISLADGIESLRKFLLKNGFNKKSILWTRGTLDSMCIDDAIMDLKAEKIFEYWQIKDIRTALDFIVSDPFKISVPKEILNMDKFVGHDPVHDAARDLVYLKYGK